VSRSHVVEVEIQQVLEVQCRDRLDATRETGAVQRQNGVAPSSEQLARLNNLECDLGQGFLWSPAVPFDEVTNMLGEMIKT